MINENLREISYLARQSRIDHSVGSSNEGIILCFHGFNDGIQNFIKDIFKLVTPVNVSFEK